jgi:hypothetical protein
LQNKFANPIILSYISNLKQYINHIVMPRKGGVPENLRPCKPGETHNPNGRPRKLPNLDKLLAEVLGEEEMDGKVKAQKIVEALFKEAAKGNPRAADILLDRAYGKVKQIMEIPGSLNVTHFQAVHDMLKKKVEDAGKD